MFKVANQGIPGRPTRTSVARLEGLGRPSQTEIASQSPANANETDANDEECQQPETRETNSDNDHQLPNYGESEHDKGHQYDEQEPRAAPKAKSKESQTSGVS